MWKEDLYQKKIWLEGFNDKVNQYLDEFYSTIPDSDDLTGREQYLYDTAQNLFKMLYELTDHSKGLLNAELMNIQDAAATRRSADTQI